MVGVICRKKLSLTKGTKYLCSFLVGITNVFKYMLPGHFFSHGGVLSVVGEVADDEVHVQKEGGKVVAHVGQALHQVEP